MQIGVLKESKEKRVAIVPLTLKKQTGLAPFFIIEKGAGLLAGFHDSTYAEYCSFASRGDILKNVDVLLSIRPLPENEIQQLKKGAIFISLFEPYNKPDIITQLQKNNIHAFSLDMIPRSSIAQSMDVLSSMASISGYKAVLAGANHLDRYFPMMMTAAGTIRPAKVLILGAGVAGLQAIATAKKLGAMVEAFDVRKASKEEVESLGAKFIQIEGASDDIGAGGYAVEQSEDFIKRQRQEIQDRAIKADVIITTAQLRGKKAPVLIETTTVEKMQPGSIIVDLASDSGGNCALTQNNKIINHNGIVIIGNSNLADEMPKDASTLFSNNVMNFLKLLVNEKGELNIDMDNEILSASLITKASTIV